jgi:hypothetical protein
VKKNAHEEIAALINTEEFHNTIRAQRTGKFTMDKVPDYIIEELDMNIDATSATVTADDIKRLLTTIMNSHKTMFVTNLNASGKAAAEGSFARAADAWNYCIKGKLRDISMYYVFVFFEGEDIGFLGRDLPAGLGRTSGGVSGGGNASLSTPINKLTSSSNTKLSSTTSISDLKDQNIEKALNLKINDSKVTRRKLRSAAIDWYIRCWSILLSSCEKCKNHQKTPISSKLTLLRGD